MNKGLSIQTNFRRQIVVIGFNVAIRIRIGRGVGVGVVIDF